MVIKKTINISKRNTKSRFRVFAIVTEPKKVGVMRIEDSYCDGNSIMTNFISRHGTKVQMVYIEIQATLTVSNV